VPADSGDDAFVKEHYGFVKSVALRVKAELDLRCDVDDLLAYGFQGLVEAKGRWDAERNVKFTTFAYYRVRGAIIDGVRKMAYLPPSAHHLRKAAEAADWVLEELGETRATEEAAGRAAEAEQTLAQMDDALSKLSASFVIAAVGQDEAEQHDSPEERLLTGEAIARVRRALEVLPEREKIVVVGMYFENRSLDDIGAQLGVSRSWACRMHTRGLRLMREALEREENG
jgi:RNA polymerase sigma factor for flagellar operon FliA